MKRPLIAALGFLLVAVAKPAMAGWPDQPIRIVVPYPAGGAVDAMLRVMAPKMSEKLGQPIVVDNRAGANANWDRPWSARQNLMVILCLRARPSSW